MVRKSEAKCKELIRGETSQMLYPYPEYEKPFPVVILDTTAGDIILEMHMDESPRTCHSFLEYCRNGYFEPCLFNRIQKMSLASNCWSALKRICGYNVVIQHRQDKVGSPSIGKNIIFAQVVKGMDVLKKMNKLPINKHYRRAMGVSTRKDHNFDCRSMWIRQNLTER